MLTVLTRVNRTSDSRDFASVADAIKHVTAVELDLAGKGMKKVGPAKQLPNGWMQTYSHDGRNCALVHVTGPELVASAPATATHLTNAPAPAIIEHTTADPSPEVIAAALAKVQSTAPSIYDRHPDGSLVYPEELALEHATVGTTTPAAEWKQPNLTQLDPAEVAALALKAADQPLGKVDANGDPVYPTPEQQAAIDLAGAKALAGDPNFGDDHDVDLVLAYLRHIGIRDGAILACAARIWELRCGSV